MGKYIDADRLRAEIKERTLFYAGQANLLADTTTLDGFDEILSIIDSLQQKQPEVDLKKAALHVYESWMGGTMDDVRRDMVELGRVINARQRHEKDNVRR